MVEIARVPADKLGDPSPETFFAAFNDPNVIGYFVLNVGDGDSQLVVLPPSDGTRPRLAADGQPAASDRKPRRRAIVVDIAKANKHKMPALIKGLAEKKILSEHLAPSAQGRVTTAFDIDQKAFPLAIATHPHDDHIGGMTDFIEDYSEQITEFWEPGYYHPTASFIRMMRALEANPQIVLSQPAAGLRRFVDGVRVTVLSPSIQLKNRYDSYGVEINNSSIAIKLEYPYSRVLAREARQSPDATRSPDPADRIYKKFDVRSIILGGDAQTVAWGRVINDFPRLDRDTSPAFEALNMARGVKPLKADVFKVPHHASKHGVNLELVEFIDPKYTIVSSVADGGHYNFPHQVALESIREAVQPTTSKRSQRMPDHDLGIRFTSDRNDRDEPLGSIAITIPPSGRIKVWRFGDERRDPIDLENAFRQH